MTEQEWRNELGTKRLPVELVGLLSRADSTNGDWAGNATALDIAAIVAATRMRVLEKRTVAPAEHTGKIRFPKPSRIYVAGNGFVPTKDQIVFGAKGFFACHDNLEREALPPGVEMEGLIAFGGDLLQFCEVALATMFGEGKHPGAYYLDAVIAGRQVINISEIGVRQLQSGGEQMMVVMLWEGEGAKTARGQVPGGRNV